MINYWTFIDTSLQFRWILIPTLNWSTRSLYGKDIGTNYVTWAVASWDNMTPQTSSGPVWLKLMSIQTSQSDTERSLQFPLQTGLEFLPGWLGLLEREENQGGESPGGAGQRAGGQPRVLNLLQAVESSRQPQAGLAVNRRSSAGRDWGGPRGCQNIAGGPRPPRAPHTLTHQLGGERGRPAESRAEGRSREHPGTLQVLQDTVRVTCRQFWVEWRPLIGPDSYRYCALISWDHDASLMS